MADFSPKSLGSFGQTETKAPTGLSSTSVRGAERMLTITELSRVGSSLQPTGTEFRFARENFSAPRGPQEFGLELRTVRTDLPGGEEPVEQVLGWNYTEFTVKGMWDDRHAGPGYAENTRRAFEDMVKRGNPVRYQFEQLSIVGLIKKFNFLYVRKDLQGYTFTISPHFRYEGETVRVNSNSARKISLDPKRAVALARAGLEQMRLDQARATLANQARVHQLLSSGIFATINSSLDTIEGYISQAEKLVDDELISRADNATNTLNRGAQILASAKTEVASLLNKQKSLQVAVEMPIDSLVEALKFEGWNRTVAGSARRFVVDAEQSRKDFEHRAKPRPQRLYRAKQNQSLYTISNICYGTPHHWRDIFVANNLTSIILKGGELLEIPEIR